VVTVGVKTIKQIADELGVSKQKVYRFIRANKIKESNRVRTCDGNRKHEALYYDDAVETLIKSHFDTPTASDDAVIDAVDVVDDTVVDAVDAMDDAVDVASDAVVDAVIAMLKNELEIKNKQIADLTTALVAAQQTAAAAQALHAGTMHHLAIPEDKKSPAGGLGFLDRTD